jgi:hypothetical protein
MPTLATVVVHETLTGRNRYQYQSTPKHHGADAAAAQWLPKLTLEEEFAVFNLADQNELADEDGRLYGVLRIGENDLRDVGTWQQQIAEFPLASEGTPWHGYPIWAINQDGPSNRAAQKMRPAKIVFQRMETAGLITKRQRKRLYKGDHV